jgi:xanthine dehydrogenase YagS FAD-binding subunit
MNRFAIARPSSYKEAGDFLADKKYSLPVLKAGGMDVVDHLKEGLYEPDLVIDIRRVRAEGAGKPVAISGGKVRIEAGATLAEIVAATAKDSPVLAQALEGAATPQVRNVASAAGNLLQRPRCWYYRNDTFKCLKKKGATCFAVDGENQYHAIFGDGPCHIVHPSNLAPALYVSNGEVHLTGGSRASLKIRELYHTPDKGVTSEHNLEPGEIITHITCDAAPRGGFHAVKEKLSFDWPLVFACVTLDLDGTKIRSAKVCAGAVAPVPWDLPEVEKALAGVSLDDAAALKKACELSTRGAKPMSQNAYKLKLLPVAVRRAVLRAAGREVEGLV